MRRFGLADAVVHALRVGDERVARRVARGKLAPFRLGGAEEAKLQLEAVGVERRLTDDL